MKKLLLLPNIILIVISAYNLFNEQAGADYITYKLMHIAVLMCCIVFTAVLFKSILTSTPLRDYDTTEDAVIDETTA